MNIGIDIDDTISNTFQVQFDLAQNYTINVLKRDGKINEQNEIKTHFYCKSIHNWSEEENINFFKMYYKNMLENIRPKIFAKEIINKLKDEGNKIFIITARFDLDDVNAYEVSKKWLIDNGIKYDKIIVDAEDKAKIALENNIDIFIDDSFSNCEAINNSNIKTYIMNSPVNKGLNNENIERVYSWTHFYQRLKEEYNGTI